MKYSPEQLTLPYDTPSESAVRIRSIDWRVTGLSEHTWRQVRELLIVVAYCSRRDGYCCARRETLLQLVNDHSDAQVEPLSLRTLERRHLDAVQLGLLQIERRYKRSAVRLVNQQRVNELLAASRKLAEQQRESACAKSSGGLVADQWRISGGSVADQVAALQPNQPIPTSSNLMQPDSSGRLETTKIATTREATTRTAKQAIDEATARRAVRVWRQLRGTHQHWLWLVKCFHLAGQQLSEHWLQNALEGVRRSQPRDRWAVLWTLLERGSEAEGRSLRGLLATLEVPEQLARPRLRQPHERLCAGEQP